MNHDITDNLINVACRVVIKSLMPGDQSQNHLGSREESSSQHVPLEKASANFKNILRISIYLYIAQEANSKPHSVLARSRQLLHKAQLWWRKPLVEGRAVRGGRYIKDHL